MGETKRREWLSIDQRESGRTCSSTLRVQPSRLSSPPPPASFCQLMLTTGDYISTGESSSFHSEMDYAAETLLAHLEFFNDSLFHNNFSGGYNETDALLPTGVKVTIVVVYMIVCIIGLVGNFLVMYVIIR
ncbi:hypothetical protein ATANTOWER_009855 [Ataeniobius toweri]|uniref:Uncharacterized protein n=1 Tax=Ataeniobius toweri TaxID=208326 RepID=A0ABU7AY34_9TELE|nr:hypothetical protein [Ataeniobius toweri]